MKKRIGRSTDIGYQINNKFLNPRPIPKDHINNTFYFNHMKKP